MGRRQTNNLSVSIDTMSHIWQIGKEQGMVVVVGCIVSDAFGEVSMHPTFF